MVAAMNYIKAEVLENPQKYINLLDTVHIHASV